MRVVIWPEENRVSVEGFSEFVECSSLNADINVIQWYTDHGEIEFWNGHGATTIQENERITDFTPYQHLVDAWHVEAQKES